VSDRFRWSVIWREVSHLTCDDIVAAIGIFVLFMLPMVVCVVMGITSK
jgi:hypothetical protein